MALAPGTKLDPYEVLSLVGAGGVAEVYRARDSRLGLRDLLKRCMAKDPRQRLRDIGDARLELDQLLALGASQAMAVDEISLLPAEARGAALPWWGTAAFVAAAIAATSLIQSRAMIAKRAQ
jgi:hypothetical protein